MPRSASSANGDDASVALTKREHEILQLIAAGYTAKQIARELHISPYTVRTHRDNLRRKLGAHNGAQRVWRLATGEIG